jgi:aspartyl-tRNA(Asn)/glutamyl-tRNA(Gln) amidotransferase subunit B
MDMDYEICIGLETHVQVKTRTKVFCACPTEFGAEPNSNVCPVCLGYPGSLPVINEEAIRKTVLAGLLVGGRIARYSKFDRKNYFYPDMPKNYQISQYDLPLVIGGEVEFGFGVVDKTRAGETKVVRLTRIHLEEDVGKNFHFERTSGVDFNRAGTPLMEIVSEPDMSSPDEAFAYLTALKEILIYGGISDCDMEKGQVRCDVNVSVRPCGQKTLGQKIEIKNMNTFSGARRALEYEARRQMEALKRGGTLAQETRRWDDVAGITESMRVKEHAHDYRYFPEPDLPPLTPERGWIEEIALGLPELPDARVARFVDDLGLDPRDAAVLAGDRAVADYFEAAVRECTAFTASHGRVSARTVANWITGELFRLMNARGLAIDELKVTPGALAELLTTVDAGQISPNSGKRVLEVMFDTGRRAPDIVQEMGLAQVSDAGALSAVVADVVARYPDEVAKYRAGGEKVMAWFMGQVMRETRGKGNPAVVRELLEKALREAGVPN